MGIEDEKSINFPIVLHQHYGNTRWEYIYIYVYTMVLLGMLNTLLYNGNKMGICIHIWGNHME